MVQLSGFWIGCPAVAPGFLVSAFLSSLILEDAWDLFKLEGSIWASLSAARVERKAFCLSVGASLPVAHSDGLSSWEVIFEEVG